MANDFNPRPDDFIRNHIAFRIVDIAINSVYLHDVIFAGTGWLVAAFKAVA